MSTLRIHGGPLLTPFERIDDGALLARDGRIERAVPRAQLADASTDVSVDAGGRLICPGFVDLQVNGGGGALLTDEPTTETLARITQAHVRFGTTSLLATVVTSHERRIIDALAAVRAAVDRGPAGARVLGAHLEGPFISPERRGAHDSCFIQPPDRDALARLLAAAGSTLRVLTLAPELPGALELIEDATAASVAVSVGHTNATFDETMRAFDAGATLGTHLYNAMRPFDRREPGAIGALLQYERAIVGLIADGVHVHPAALDVAFRAKGPDGVALVTDAMPAVGSDAASFELGGRTIIVRDGACWLEDGTLAGSALSMNRAVRNMRDHTPADLDECVRMATATPARALGLEGEVGVLAPGARADVVLCDDDMNVWKVFVGGELAYDVES